MDNNVAMVTGATSGLGEAAARQLVRHGFDVIVAGRSQASAEAVRRRLQNCAPDTVIVPAWGDLSRQVEVRRMAANVLARHGRLDVLINNAGANFPARVITEDGVEQTLAINALAPVLLTTLLMPVLHAAKGRVVNVASGLLKTPDPQRWTGGFPYSQMAAYSESKAALILLTEQMAHHHPDVAMVSMTPGMVRTKLDRNTTDGLRIFLTAMKMISKSPDDAAANLVGIATCPISQLESGAFYKRGKVAQPDSLASTASIDAGAFWSTAVQLISASASQ